MEITIDEWIVHYIADVHKCKQVFVFLYKVFRKCDKFVTLNGSPLMKKIWDMSRESGCWEETQRMVARYFLQSFVKNSEKFHIFYQHEIISLPDELRQLTPNDDIYLVEIAINSKDMLILTTDSRLKEILSGQHELNIQLVEEYIHKYNC